MESVEAVSGGFKCSEPISGTLRSDCHILQLIQVSDTVTRAHSSFPSGQSITTAEDQSLEASSGSRHTQDQQLQQRQI